MSATVYDVLVMGGEPAGVWLLNSLAQTAPFLKLAWVSPSGSEPPLVWPSGLLPDATPHSENISPWHIQIATPQGILWWRPDVLAGLSRAWNLEFIVRCQKFTKVSPADLGTLRFVIRENPEILSLAASVWKWVGRTDLARPETVLLAALKYSDVSWAPPPRAPEGCDQRVLPTERVETFERTHDGIFELAWAGSPPIRARNLVWNASVTSLGIVAAKIEWLSKAVRSEARLAALSARAQYTLSFSADPACIPDPIRNLCLHLDSLDQCGVGSLAFQTDNVQPKAKTKRVSLFVEAPYEVVPEVIADAFRASLGKLGRRLPFLLQGMDALSLPLSLDCLSEDKRSAWVHQARNHRQERYSLTELQWGTALPNLFLLAPSVGCHLPYPQGTLQAASQLLALLLKRGKVKAASRHTPKQAKDLHSP